METDERIKRVWFVDQTLPFNEVHRLNKSIPKFPFVGHPDNIWLDKYTNIKLLDVSHNYPEINDKFYPASKKLVRNVEMLLKLNDLMKR